ncbi:MAG: cupin domain-containing protein [Chloroflexi bacterium]|nr:cupin domain-containing protein [Chloroflexota bacterium]
MATETTGTGRLFKVVDEDVRGDRNYEEKQKVRTKGWQVVSIPDNIRINPNTDGYIQLTNNRYAQCVINVYQPGQRDEMHCHPGSEHIFMVFQGELHLYGLDPEEDIILKAGELVHINQSYFYQLANETDDLTVLYQVATKLPKPPKKFRYSYRPDGGVDPRSLEGE